MTLQARYWCRQSLVVTVDGPQGPRTTTVEKPYARLSARKSAEIVLPDLRIAGRGLYLHATDAGVFCIGFSHAEAAEEPWHGWLRPDQTVAFGPYQVSACLAGPAGSPEATFPAVPDLAQKGTAGEPCPIIAVAFKDSEIARRRLSRSLTVVGRLRPSALPIHSNDLSASHLAFYWSAGTLWVIDLLSRLGTYLEGIPIECAELPLGCSLTAGEVRLTFSALFSRRREKQAELPLQVSMEAPGPAGERTPEEPAVVERESPSGAEPVDCSSAGPTETSLAEPPAAAELESRERALRQQQEAWAAQQRQRAIEWRQRTAELAQREAALAAEQQRQRTALARERRATEEQIGEWTASIERLRAELTRQQGDFQKRQDEWLSQQKERESALHDRSEELSRRQAALDAEQEQSRRRQQEFDERRAQWEAEQSGAVERLRAEMERQRARPDAETAPPAEEMPQAGPAEAPAPPPPALPAVRLPAVELTAGPDASAAPGGKEFDASYEEVLDRLMLVSRRRSSRLHRLWEACGGLWRWVSRRWTARPPRDPPDRDHGSPTGT